MDLIMMCISCALCEIVFIGCCVCVFVGVNGNEHNGFNGMIITMTRVMATVIF